MGSTDPTEGLERVEEFESSFVVRLVECDAEFHGIDVQPRLGERGTEIVRLAVRPRKDEGVTSHGKTGVDVGEGDPIFLRLIVPIVMISRRRGHRRGPRYQTEQFPFDPVPRGEMFFHDPRERGG